MRTVLDHGYLKLVEVWGSDERIIEAARMSTNKGFKGWGSVEAPGDEKLLGFLYTHKHMTPFEMAGLTVEVQAPIFVIREWQRHRTQSFNEMSARYTPLPDVNYVPTLERVMAQTGASKQSAAADGVPRLSEVWARSFLDQLVAVYAHTQDEYKEALANGVPKELARLVLPVGRYSRMRASANLRNWLSFLALRLDEAAQWEIRQYATVLSDLVSEHFPRTWKLFTDEA